MFLLHLSLLKEELLDSIVFIDELFAQEVHIFKASLSRFHMVLQLQAHHLLSLELRVELHFLALELLALRD